MSTCGVYIGLNALVGPCILKETNKISHKVCKMRTLATQKEKKKNKTEQVTLIMRER